VVVNALMSQKDKLAAEYAQLPMTVSQAFTRLSQCLRAVDQPVDESTGFTKKLAEALTWLGEPGHGDASGWRIAEVGLAVLIYRLIPALITAWQTAGAAAVTAASATAAAWATANLSVSAAVATVGKLAWRSPCWARPRRLGDRHVAVREVRDRPQGEHLHGRGAGQGHRAPALPLGGVRRHLHSDTIAEATKRHEQRLAEMNQIFAQMYADATKGRTLPRVR
jgi:phage-related minor tail protein